MKKIMFMVSNLVLLFVMSGCGGGGGGGSTSAIPPPSPGTASSTISWAAVTVNEDGSPCADLAGYRVYYGLISPVNQNNSNMRQVLSGTEVTINGFELGKTYYFRLSSFDIAGNESALSDEVSKTYQ
jgi:hypothetical protein